MLRRFTLPAALVSATSLRCISAESIDRVGQARVAINNLWAQHGNDPISPLSAIHNEGARLDAPSEANARIAECAAAARGIMDTFKLSPQVARDEDITSALGDALERLLLLLVPLEPESVPYVERALLMAARAQHELGIRTVQHLFARTRTYAEALTLFHLLRQCHVKMNMHSYYAMVFCLQRLEEESWALRFREEAMQRRGKLSQKKQSEASSAAEHKSGKQQLPEDASEPSVQALTFILSGCDNQLLPESKPWIGRVAFSDAEGSYSLDATTKTADHFDQLSNDWAARFRENNATVEQTK